MTVDGLDDDAVRAILERTRRVAVVGASPRQDRPSNGVFRFLRARGFDVVPVNPAAVGEAIDGFPIVGSLAAASPLDMVDVFRRNDTGRRRVISYLLSPVMRYSKDAGRER